MKSIFAFAIFAAVAAEVFAGNEANPDAIELSPIPVPVEMKADMDTPVAFGPDTKVLVECDGDSDAAVEWINKHFAEWYGEFAPKAVAGQSRSIDDVHKEGDEVYEIIAASDSKVDLVFIAANKLAGIRWAAYTLRQLTMAARGTMTTKGYIIPKMHISDAPHLKFRGMHLCWFPETRPEQIERAIRLAALMKFNYCVLEPWGTYRSAKHPWFGWKDGKATKDEIKRLVAIGKDLGITLIPQLNCFGHAALSRTGSLKHAVLDMQPQYEPLFEPGGWNWCLTNPETQRILRELIAEMYEDFGKPPYFHLGCDEAQPPTCPECRKAPYGETVCKHIIGLTEYVKTLGARPIIWHDMLVVEADPKWKGYVAFGTPATAKLYDLLPKDVILCDWQYYDLEKGRKDFPTMEHFFKAGFPVIGAPFTNKDAMRPMADCIAANPHGFGFLQTTWHLLRSQEWRDMYRYGAAAAWGTDIDGKVPANDLRFTRALRMVGLDMHLTDPLDTGVVNTQLAPVFYPAY